MLLALTLLALPKVLMVGDGKQFSRVEEAITAARPGDTIEVFPRASGYAATAVLVEKPNLRIVAHQRPVALTGKGFDYSGVGRIPRAIFQFNPEAVGCTLRGFSLSGAHNSSHNGAGVRINGAGSVTVEDCDIFGNDMGIMSAGPTATNQRIVLCHIHHNGDASDPGYNHNLYLGGADVTLENCEIDHALTGHDLKSRAHFTLVKGCYLHDSANREFDFVDAKETEAPNSNAVLLDNLIVKHNHGGNGNVIHFGQERGVRHGTLYVLNNTIRTDSVAPVIALDGDTRAELANNLIVSEGQAKPTLAIGPVTGGNNWLSAAYGQISLSTPDRAAPTVSWSYVGLQGPVTFKLARIGASRQWTVN